MTAIEPFRINGWRIAAHALFLDQVEAMVTAVLLDRKKHPGSFQGRRAAKMLAAVVHLAFRCIPEDPGNAVYRQGNTLGEAYRHWRRAKFYQQYRLFFRYRDSGDEKIIVYGWVNDETTKRAYDSRSDAYAVFRRMLESGHPPDDWETLVAECANTAKRLDEVMASAGHTIVCSS